MGNGCPLLICEDSLSKTPVSKAGDIGSSPTITPKVKKYLTELQ